MTSRTRFIAICFALAVWFWCTAGAFAQERPASAQPDDPTTRAAALSGIWDTITWVERRYKIEAMRFKARDETGIDWLGSDEVMVETRDAKGWTVSDEIGNINSGDTHHFDPVKSCIVPVRPGIVVLGKTSVCDDVGEPAPLGFRVEMWEKDLNIFGGFSKCPAGADSHAGPHCVAQPGDDFIGRAQIDLSAQELEAALPNVGNEHIETVVLYACHSGDVCNVTFGPDYSFTFRVTRLPDVRVVARSVLDEAMQRSGIRSELEGIAAGLRSLRAPSPRKIEPETVR